MDLSQWKSLEDIVNNVSLLHDDLAAQVSPSSKKDVCRLSAEQNLAERHVGHIVCMVVTYCQIV